MELTWMILLLLLLCAEAKNLTEVQVDVGQSATLNCSVNKTSVHWYMEIHSHIPQFIVRTFNEDPDNNKYNDSSLRNKFIGVGRKLVITNITAEDFRVYICARKQDDNIIFKDAFSLTSGVRVTASTNDGNVTCHQQRDISSFLENKIVTCSSFALNALLTVVLMGVFSTYLCSKKSCKDQLSEPSPFTCENTETVQYEEIQLSNYRTPPPAAAPSDCIYHKAQLPRPTTPH